MFRAYVLIVRRTKIVLYSLWYHHTYRWPSGAQIEKGLEMHGQQNIKVLCIFKIVSVLTFLKIVLLIVPINCQKLCQFGFYIVGKLVRYTAT